MIEFLFAVVVGFVLSLVIGSIWLAYMVNKIQRDNEQTTEQLREVAHSLIEKLIFIRVEEHPEGLFAYDAVSGDYVCQGKDMEDLSTNFGKRYPNKKGVMVKPDEGEASELLQRNQVS
jgi:hypothetical protein